ncbi:hypothetical protein IG631_13407 [Alternaria alternata]|nr:hypothetical protein IG631_13407 [Alternaria alternata]
MGCSSCILLRLRRGWQYRNPQGVRMGWLLLRTYCRSAKGTTQERVGSGDQPIHVLCREVLSLENEAPLTTWTRTAPTRALAVSSVENFATKT